MNKSATAACPKDSSALLMVDLNDQVVGYATKHACHSRPVLHRAFSVFLHNNGRMLLQQRALEKYHSGGLWTNACCSHPHPEEPLPQAVAQRLKEELGIVCPCREEFRFLYYHKFQEDLYEYEIDHVFTGFYDGPVLCNPEEAMAVKWVPFEELKQDVWEHPERYTVWFVTALPRVLAQLEGDQTW